MNNRFGIVAGVIASIFVPLCSAQSAQADPSFEHNSNISMSSDTSGFASGNAYGQNAVVTDISAGESYNFQGKGFARQQGGLDSVQINTWMSISGIFGDPNKNSSYYNYLQNNGLHVFGSVFLTKVNFDGIDYQFDDDVSLNAMGSAYLSRDDAHTSMLGYFSSTVNGSGVIPISASCSVQIFEPGHPDWLPDWRAYISTNWLVTTSFSPAVSTPTPGATALFGLASTMMYRRRR